MKSDTGTPDEGWPTERAHLKDPNDTTHTIFRYPAPPDLRDLVRRYWIPVWQVQHGRDAPQHVLRYPVCLVVVADDYARFYGVASGLSTKVLTGEGWAVGVMLTPATGALLTGGALAAFTDRMVDVEDVLGDAGADAAERIREAMLPDPRSPEAHRTAMGIYDDIFRSYLPVDDEGRLVNRVVAFVEDNPDVLRVEQVRVDDEDLSIVLVQPTATNTPYPQHARNYLDHEPKLPDPLIDPHRVAEAILDAAQKGGRDAKVGAMSHMNTTISKLLPSLAERLAAKQVDRQEHERPPLDPDGTLYKAGESGRVYGVDKDGRILDR